MKTKILLASSILLSGLILCSCEDNDDISISKDNIITSVITGEAQSTSISATITGSVSNLSTQSVTAYSAGIRYSVNQDMTSAINVSGVPDSNGNFTVTLSGLTKGVTYYYSTYVTLQQKVSYYGETKSFTTTDALIVTHNASSVTPVSAILSASLNGVKDLIDSDNSFLEYGIYLSRSNTFNEIKNSRYFKLKSETSDFSIDAKGLLPDTEYYFMSYMRLNGADVYGDIKAFKTTEFETEFVNLGLSVEWASCNIGAVRAEDNGGLFGWGDISGLNTSGDLENYGINEDITGTEYDLCAESGVGMLPTYEQYQELMKVCSHKWENLNGVDGYRFTSPNGNSIFLPAGGSRYGEECSQIGVSGIYWSGNIEKSSPEYAYSLKFNNSSTEMVSAKRCEGLSIRAVRPVPEGEVASLLVDNSKLLYGNIESDNGNYRIEIYNEYGASKDNLSIDKTKIRFEQNITIKFKLSGFEFNTGAKGTYRAGIQYSAPGWWPSYWSDGNSIFDTRITGDGEYTVSWMTSNTCEDALVFCVDIMDDIVNDISDISKTKVEIISIKFDDPGFDIKSMDFDNDKILFVNKDGNNTDGRIEIFNMYGPTNEAPGVNIDELNFNGTMVINYKIEGIDGNLISGASADYKSDISYAGKDWDPSYWGGGDGYAMISKDGDYTVSMNINKPCSGAVVWCVELYDIWKDLVDPELVKITINSILLK